jgi:hypothetical protein
MASRLMQWKMNLTKEVYMPEREQDSVPGLLRGLLEDIRDLIRGEIALARAEIYEGLTAAQTVGVALAAAAGAAAVGITLLCIAIGGAIATFFGWPTWTGYLIVALLLLCGAWLLGRYARNLLSRLRGLPKTRQTVKENLAWIHGKSSGK